MVKWWLVSWNGINVSYTGTNPALGDRWVHFITLRNNYLGSVLSELMFCLQLGPPVRLGHRSGARCGLQIQSLYTNRLEVCLCHTVGQVCATPHALSVNIQLALRLSLQLNLGPQFPLNPYIFFSCKSFLFIRVNKLSVKQRSKCDIIARHRRGAPYSKSPRN